MKTKLAITTLLAAAAACAYAAPGDAPVKPPVMGWSSWNGFAVNISDSIIMNQADRLVELGLKDAGFNHVNIDDGYFGRRDADGNMTPNPDRFPRGMKHVPEYIHSLGLKAGCYTDAGHNTCGSMWSGDPIGKGVGIYGHEAQDAQLYFGDWDFDFIKIDYCGAEELLLDEKEQYTRIAEAVAKVKPGVSINICRWAFPGTWAKNVAASWRISTDIRAKWELVKLIVEKNQNLSAYARDGHYNDMDMLVIGLHGNSAIGGDGLSETEEKAHFGMWCIMSSPLLIGADLNKLAESSLDILRNTELIAVNQDRLGRQAYPVVVNADGTAVFAKDIEELHGLRRAVAFYNPTDEEKTVTIPLAELELGGKVKVRNLTERKDAGTFEDSFGMTLAPHSATILRMDAQKRLEPARYEAEWGYMPLFNDLGTSKAAYRPDNRCSNGWKATGLGDSRYNHISWDNVWSDKGGDYIITVNVVDSKDRRLWVDVNGKKSAEATVDADGKASVAVPVHLEKGFNTVKFGNNNTPLPDIDNFTLTKTKF